MSLFGSKILHSLWFFSQSTRDFLIALSIVYSKRQLEFQNNV